MTDPPDGARREPPFEIRRASAWSASEIRRHLEQTVIPVRLACNTASGSPLLCSLWFLYDEDRIWCATQRGSKIARCLEADPRCGFEVAGDTPPYRGVRGQGRAALVGERGEEMLGRLLDRYFGGRDSELARWLLGRASDEVAIRIEPAWVTAWDFTERMKDL